jgi:hypothetical protein
MELTGSRHAWSFRVTGFLKHRIAEGVRGDYLRARAERDRQENQFRLASKHGQVSISPARNSRHRRLDHAICSSARAGRSRRISAKQSWLDEIAIV